MNEKEQVDSVIFAIEKVHALLEQIPSQLAKAQAAKLKEEKKILLLIKKQVVDWGWFNKVWEEYITFKTQGVDNSAILIALSPETRKYDFWKGKLIPHMEVTFYLEDKVPPSTIQFETKEFIRELMRAEKTINLFFSQRFSKEYQAAKTLFWETFKPKKNSISKNHSSWSS